jgi:predicted acyl esterase
LSQVLSTAAAERRSLDQLPEGLPMPEARTYMVPMRDGVKLATDVVLPKGKPDAKYPAILVRTPYSRRGNIAALAGNAVSKVGFAAVLQDLRGRFDSEGEDFPVHLGCAWGKIQDGYDTIEWIAKQPWSDGRVGTVGPSAMGATQNLTLPTRPPHLTCAFVIVAWADVYKHGAYWGGVPSKALAEGWIRDNRFDRRNLDAFKAHPNYDEVWQTWNTEKQAPRVNVPVMYFGGWYDHFTQGTIDSFIATRTHGGPGAKDTCRLVMGPWTHTGLPKGLDYPPNAEPKYELEGITWFMRHLKGADPLGAAKQKPVRYYVMGASGEHDAPGHAWRWAEDWPVPSENVCCYLRKGGLLSTDRPAEAEASATYEYDPKNPVPSIGGGVLTVSAGIQDQRPVEGRKDVILFTTPVLNEPVEATGRIRVKLWASSSCKDTDFTAKLTDVYPDGRSLLVLDGIIRAAYRDSLTEPRLMEPGKVYPMEIDLWSTSIIFNKGHRIRLAISSSNDPRFEPNKNTGKLFEPDDETLVARNTIYFDKDRPSHIVLPRPMARPAEK